MADIPAVAQQQFGAFTRAQATATGWSRDALSHALAADRLVRLRRGVYADAALVSTSGPADRRRWFRLVSAAASLGGNGALASHRSAAALAGLPLLTV
ncbi:MAG: type IV toxin-antitoxin system AbiEi family antitoxin domain-containing protein, partial [Actinomycetota bacterium]|nr:type IV toxin-antitoxin system AbiEi family antitoxin domain-containing protein [Actinomycetota bacterium]